MTITVVSRDYVTVVSLFQGLRGSYNCYSVIVLRTTIQTYGYYSVGSALADNYRAQHRAASWPVSEFRVGNTRFLVKVLLYQQLQNVSAKNRIK